MREDNLYIAQEIFKDMKDIWPTELSKKINGLFSGTNYILCYLIEQDKEVTSGDISSALNMSTPRMSAALNTLEKKNYIKRKRYKNDARKTIIVITEDGINYLNELQNKMINFIVYLIEKLGIEEITLFRTQLIKMRNALIDYEHRGNENHVKVS